MAAKQQAEIHFSSSCDFAELTMNIIEEQGVNPDTIALNIKLRPAAGSRLQQISRSHLNQTLVMYINGTKVSAATVQAELNTGKLRVAVDKQTAQKIFIGLLGNECFQR